MSVLLTSFGRKKTERRTIKNISIIVNELSKKETSPNVISLTGLLNDRYYEYTKKRLLNVKEVINNNKKTKNGYFQFKFLYWIVC